MVKEVIRFQAADGRLFDNLQHAEKYEEVCGLAYQLKEEFNWAVSCDCFDELAQWIHDRYEKKSP